MKILNKKLVKTIFNAALMCSLMFFAIAVLTVSLRGNPGNPDSKELNNKYWKEAGPFELSPERGRFALLYSIVEDKSFQFNLDIARFATPDLAISDGKYVSLFAPLLSFIASPGYFIGKLFGLAQVGAYSTIALFGILNALLIRSIATYLGANRTSATLGSVVFLFASPAFSYAVTLYQHHISTFLILSTLFLVLKYKNWLSLFLVWLLFATSVPVDYPNLVLMFPLALYATTRILWAKKEQLGIKIVIKPLHFFTIISVVIPLLFYAWFSQSSYGKPLQLAGTLKAVKAIDSQGRPLEPTPIILQDNSYQPEASVKKSAVGFFQTRSMMNGMYIHFFSPDRGVLFYTPIMFFAILGGYFLWRKKQTALVLITSVIGVSVILYSMWGDPWGGWAFGSRYLIPSYALSAILIAVAVSKLNKRILFSLLFALFIVYSVGVNTLGAISTNANPPKVEAVALEKISNVRERYSFDRNWQFLNTQGSKSFFYNTYLRGYITPLQFFWILSSSISGVLIAILLFDYVRRK